MASAAGSTGTPIDDARWGRLRRSLLLEEDSDEMPDVLIQLVGRYAQTSDERLAALREACRAGDGEQAARVLHKIKGSNAMLAAVQVERLAAEAEERLNGGEPVGGWLGDILRALEHAAAEADADLRRRTGE